ncbi:MAG: methyl-accepting chemotaxis protein [Phycisphaerales bacterium]
MKLTIGRKLGFGFGLIIILMVASAGVAYYKLADIDRSAQEISENAVPATMACDRMLIDLNRSLSTVRGFLLFGDEDAQAAVFRSNYEESWQEVNRQRAQLAQLVDDNADSDQARRLSSIDEDLKALRTMQDAAMAEAFRAGNVEYRDLLLTESAPRTGKLFDMLSGMIQSIASDEANADRQVLLTDLARARGRLGAADAALRMAVLTKNISGARDQYKQEFSEHWQRYTAALDAAKTHAAAMSPSQARAWDEFERAQSEYAPLPARILASREREDANKAEYMMETQATPLARKIRSDVESLADTLTTEMNNEMGTLQRASTAMSVTLVVSSLLAAVLGTGIAVVLSRRIVSSIQAIVGRARRIAEGDLSDEMIDVRSDDEIRVLADSFNEMLRGLRNLTGQIGQVTANINSSSAEILAAAQQQASSTREQAATVQQISSTMQELSRSGEQVRERAADVAVIAENTSKATAEGIRIVFETSETMETIREQVEQVAQNIIALSERTQTIGEIIATVNDMSEQSNLLALNASIESVSAGEQGSRFGVVAAEMKNLADQAKQSTTQVRSILGEIQKGINTSVMLTEEAVKRVAVGKERSALTEATIRDVTESANESVNAFQQITGATSQQLTGFEQVTQGMGDIRTASEQTAASTAQLERSAADLNALSAQLRSAVERYKL